jgi:hypothetical protein
MRLVNLENIYYSMDYNICLIKNQPDPVTLIDDLFYIFEVFSRFSYETDKSLL